MAGIKIEVDTKELSRSLNRLANLIPNRDLMGDIAEELLNSTHDRFDITKTAPDGTPWREISRPHKKSNPLGGILIDSQELRDSIITQPRMMR